MILYTKMLCNVFNRQSSCLWLISCISFLPAWLVRSIRCPSCNAQTASPTCQRRVHSALWSLHLLQKARNISSKFISLEASNRNRSKEQLLGGQIPHFHTSIQCGIRLIISMKLSKNDAFSELCLAQNETATSLQFQSKTFHKDNSLRLHMKDIVGVLNPTHEAHWKGCTLCQVGLISRALWASFVGIKEKYREEEYAIYYLSIYLYIYIYTYIYTYIYISLDSFRYTLVLCKFMMWQCIIYACIVNIQAEKIQSKKDVLYWYSSGIYQTKPWCLLISHTYTVYNMAHIQKRCFDHAASTPSITLVLQDLFQLELLSFEG